MDTALKNLIGTECFIYLDDMITFSPHCGRTRFEIEHIAQVRGG
jgi:hypothetical protein